jgi:hypothetical protein
VCVCCYWIFLDNWSRLRRDETLCVCAVFSEMIKMLSRGGARDFTAHGSGRERKGRDSESKRAAPPRKRETVSSICVPPLLS